MERQILVGKKDSKYPPDAIDFASAVRRDVTQGNVTVSFQQKS